MKQLLKMPVSYEDIKSPNSLEEAINDAINMAFIELKHECIPITWISAYSRRPISNADYWAITRMVSEWEKENETN